VNSMNIGDVSSDAVQDKRKCIILSELGEMFPRLETEAERLVTSCRNHPFQGFSMLVSASAAAAASDDKRAMRQTRDNLMTRTGLAWSA